MTNLTQNFPEETAFGRIYITPDNLKPGTRTYRVIAHIITNSLDPGEQYYAVPLDSKVIDFITTEKPTQEGVQEFLESKGFDLTKGTWRLMDWLVPMTDGEPDPF